MCHIAPHCGTYGGLPQTHLVSETSFLRLNRFTNGETRGEASFLRLNRFTNRGDSGRSARLQLHTEL